MKMIKSFKDYMVFVDNVIKDYEFEYRSIDGDFPSVSKQKEHIEELLLNKYDIFVDSSITKGNKGRIKISVFINKEEIFYSYFTRTENKQKIREIYCSAPSLNYSSYYIRERYFNNIALEYTDNPCKLCGTTDFSTRKNGLCNSCNAKIKERNVKEITLDCGVVLKGEDRCRHIAYEKRQNEKKQGLINGSHFLCKSCKKIKVISSKSLNKKNDICKWCARRFSEDKEFEREGENIKNVKEMIKRKRDTPIHERAEALKNENDMIAKFLSNKNK